MSEATGTSASFQAILRAEAAVHAGQLAQALVEYSSAAELAASDPGGDAPAADAWRGAAIVEMRLGRWDEAFRKAAESRRMAAEMRDERRLAQAENLLGAIEFERGNWYQAGLRYGTAREYAGTIGDEPLLLEIEHNDGVLWAAQGNPRRAEESFRWALSRFEELERHPFGAKVLNNLAMVLAADGRFEEAEALYERALSECKRRSDLALAATVMVNRARLALAVNDVIRAHTLAATARVFSERLDQGPLRADVACVMGAVASTLKNWAEAEESLRLALAQSADGTAPHAEAQVWSELGELYAAQGRREESREAWLQASRSFRAMGAAAGAERAEARIATLGAEESEQVGS